MDARKANDDSGASGSGGRGDRKSQPGVAEEEAEVTRRIRMVMTTIIIMMFSVMLTFVMMAC